jgi:N-methylhydantoinase A/oxoprolinase/acetone carboxylase beta subunit
MIIALGIDTGGTYTDAVLLDHDSGQVLAATKALTTHRNLALGIEAAIKKVFEPEARLNGHLTRLVGPEEIGLVGLSTTLATNAIVEGQGSPVCLILIGYDRELIRKREFNEELVTGNVVYLAGGHDIDGEERHPLDEAAARREILAQMGRVSAFAVSGYFSVRNPSHELRVKALIEELAAEHGQELPVTCGHELTTKLNAIRRATTVALNARLIPTLRDLILTVRKMLDSAGVSAPLMIVKGDGSLVGSEWAVRRPIETILSGPAASVMGAWHIAGRKDVWVVDVGGTTTDIAALRDGHPRLNPEGAQVGHWRTMIEAADVHTVGLGGDSHVQLAVPSGASRRTRQADLLTVGPQRVLPLCRLGSDYPEVLEELRLQKLVKKRPLLALLGQFLIPRRSMPVGLAESGRAGESDRALLERLSHGPVSLVSLAQDSVYQAFLMDRVNRLVSNQLVLRVGFTPTDALHVLGRFEEWDTEASRLGAELLAAQVGLSPEAFCDSVVEAVSRHVSTEVVTKVLADEIAPPNWEGEPVSAGLLARALGLVSETDLACQFTLRQPVVAVGAPVSAYMPHAAQVLNTELILPEHAGVANAIGAVVGSVVQRARVLIRPVEFGVLYRVHLPGDFDGAGPGSNGSNRDFETLAEGVAYAETRVAPRLRVMAEEAGAQQVEVTVIRTDHSAPVREKIDDEIFLETTLSFTAMGRPATAVGS